MKPKNILAIILVIIVIIIIISFCVWRVKCDKFTVKSDQFDLNPPYQTDENNIGTNNPFPKSTYEAEKYNPAVEGARSAYIRSGTRLNNNIQFTDDTDNPGILVPTIIPNLQTRFRHPKKCQRVAFGQNKVACFDPERPPNEIIEMIVPAPTKSSQAKTKSMSSIFRYETQKTI